MTRKTPNERPQARANFAEFMSVYVYIKIFLHVNRRDPVPMRRIANRREPRSQTRDVQHALQTMGRMTTLMVSTTTMMKKMVTTTVMTIKMMMMMMLIRARVACGRCATPR